MVQVFFTIQPCRIREIILKIELKLCTDCLISQDFRSLLLLLQLPCNCPGLAAQKCFSSFLKRWCCSSMAATSSSSLLFSKTTMQKSIDYLDNHKVQTQAAHNRCTSTLKPCLNSSKVSHSFSSSTTKLLLATNCFAAVELHCTIFLINLSWKTLFLLFLFSSQQEIKM